LEDGQDRALLGELLASGLRLIALNPVREDLESYFARRIGRRAAPPGGEEPRAAAA
jgi:hypothetical protein